MYNYEYIKTSIESTGCLLITPMNKYKDTHQKLEIRCKCGNKFSVSFKTFTNSKTPKQQCNECGLKNRISKRTLPLEKLQKEINEKFNNEFEIVGEFKNRNTHTNFRHKVCGYDWLTTPTNFLRDSGCPKCNKRVKNNTIKTSKTKIIITKTDYFKDRVKELTGDEYLVLSEYTKAIEKIILKHNKCGRTYKTTPHDFISGCRCPMCWNENKLGKFQKNTNQFVNEIKEKYKNEYTIIGEYVGARTKTEVRHNKCGNIFEISPDNLLRGKGCPYCFESKGEKRIEKYLKENNIGYTLQFKINKCRNIRPLPFDFAILDNENLMCLIEYDGKQHFESVLGWGGEKVFNLIKIRDNIKNEYCEKNNIKLIRIPYYEFENIESILRREIMNET